MTVTKRDGTAKVETITDVGKPFTQNGQTMVYGYIAQRQPTARDATGHSPGECAECGRRGGPRSEARDSSGIWGRVCRTCSQLHDWERSFA